MWESVKMEDIRGDGKGSLRLLECGLFFICSYYLRCHQRRLYL